MSKPIKKKASPDTTEHLIVALIILIPTFSSIYYWDSLAFWIWTPLSVVYLFLEIRYKITLGWGLILWISITGVVFAGSGLSYYLFH